MGALSIPPPGKILMELSGISDCCLLIQPCPCGMETRLRSLPVVNILKFKMGIF